MKRSWPLIDTFFRLSDKVYFWLADIFDRNRPMTATEVRFRQRCAGFEKEPPVPVFTTKKLLEVKAVMDKIEADYVGEILNAVYRHGQKNGGATAAPGDLTIAEALEILRRER